MQKSDNQYGSFLQALGNAITNLPGRDAHLKMLPPGRTLEPTQDLHNINHSGVLLLLVPSLDTYKILFIRRPKTMKHHAGQIAFPGGKLEPTDRDIVETALRETEEEIGISPEQITVIGQLSQVFVQVSQFLITPVVGILQYEPKFNADSSEVESIHLFEINNLQNSNVVQVKPIETRTGMLQVPGYQIGEVFIWGATAMILTEFLEITERINRGR